MNLTYTEPGAEVNFPFMSAIATEVRYISRLMALQRA